MKLSEQNMNETYYHILAVDDHPIVLEGIRLLANSLNGVVCETLNDLERLKREITEKIYDLYILDLEFPDADGFTLIHVLRRQHPHCQILVYTIHEEPWVLAKLVHLNIHGVVSKQANASELLQAIQTIRKGGTLFNSTFLEIVHQKWPNIPSSEGNSFKLSSREKEVLGYQIQELSSSEIAQKIYLSINTVQTYRKRLMTKLKSKNVAELVIKGKDLI